MFPFTWKNLLCFSNIKSLPSMNLPNSSCSNQSQNHNTTSTTLVENFNSLYDLTSTSTSNLTCSADHDFNSSDSSDTNDSAPDFATVFASQRFFFASPGRSNSIFDSINSPLHTESNTLVSGSVAIQTDSPDPFHDFRKSMQEMVEAHGVKNTKADREFLHELLLCYLTLNPKHTHKVIIKAFSDLIVSLMSSESWQNIEDRRHCSTSQWLV